MTTASTSHALWHPFADMGSVDGDRMVLTRAEGPWVWDDGGRRYLDATAALWYSNLGHGRHEIAEAVEHQLKTLDAYSIFGDFANEPALELADRLAALTPTPGSRVFLGSGGGDMIETAAKIARSHHVHNGEPRRVHLIGRAGGYHGTHGVGTSVSGIAANATGFGPLVRDVSSVRHDDVGALEAEILRIGAERVAAFFCEPVIGAGGVHLPRRLHRGSRRGLRPPRRPVRRRLRDLRFGRLGAWVGVDRWPVRPDLIAVARALSGGTMPIGALIVAPHVAAPFFTGRPGAPVLGHGATYAGQPACCAAANVALDIYEREELIERGRTLEEPLAAALAPLADHPLVGEVRAGLGFLAGIDVTPRR